MPDIVLRDRSGNAVEYPGVEKIKLNTVDGGEQGFASFKDGELIPGNIAKGIEFGGVTGTMEVPASVEKTVELDFSAGAMEVTPGAGQAFSKVNIPVPKNLGPGNIAEGVNIAGIIGTLAAGGREVTIIQKTFSTGGRGSYTYTHGLGVVPDIVFAWTTADYSEYYSIYMGQSTSCIEKLGKFIANMAWYWKNTGLFEATYTSGIDEAWTAPINNATATTLTFTKAQAGTYTVYFVIGLT